MNKEKQTQISEKLFFELAQYFLLDQATPELEKSICKAISDKIDSKIKHDIYTKYKTAPTEEQREKARKEYLDKVGINESFRW